jgi:type 1 glutamine amidotransferase
MTRTGQWRGDPDSLSDRLLENWIGDEGRVRGRYDVALFYNFHKEPYPEEPIAQLGANGRGIFVLHHAILAFPQWPVWSKICGIADRSFDFFHGQTVPVEIAHAEHPITRGLDPWVQADETYAMRDAGPDSEVLLTTDHPKSMRTLAWTRRYEQSRVFCLELGHDDGAFSDPHFRIIVARGIRWLAGRL